MEQSWRALGRRTAVFAGCLVALISLFHHVPVSVASVRGGVAYFAVLLVAKLGGFALEKALAADAASSEGEGEKRV
ncbi:MAG: hypothetical protein O7B99_07190 [Planctomycetota bacterium]|nr:hypothetical protein [Planctomycetota bacterium]